MVAPISARARAGSSRPVVSLSGLSTMEAVCLLKLYPYPVVIVSSATSDFFPEQAQKVLSKFRKYCEIRIHRPPANLV